MVNLDMAISNPLRIKKKIFRHSNILDTYVEIEIKVRVRQKK